ncbi:putative transmembrane protein [Toxoplasma gondii RUB]|uniref:Transmembrane protein n=5 Tax=Toxoplasma gondii TaxID=5811 RepID=S7UVC1_TOXGG|nr:hypothetical protein TGGT1_204000 [Toxoplasma gondii GT1]KAF4642775.1 hypothetical protein TGRH88_035010 [Toxoplasma gondii]KFG39485.1 putative transmembrane protein [Toxoplasma gondii FOU]KFG61794.1 putative transmembrane protein [Toxoplasma gondii RUB]KFH07278.1 putative transmembrane protein [Toxoplasma gondii VAND]
MARSRWCASAAVLLYICLAFLAAYDSPVANAQGSEAALSHFLFDEWMSDVVPELVVPASDHESEQPVRLRRDYDKFRGQSAASALKQNRRIRTEISRILRAVEGIEARQNDSAERRIHELVLEEMREAKLKEKARRKPLKGRHKKKARPRDRTRRKAKALMGKKRQGRKVPRGTRRRKGTMMWRPWDAWAKRQGRKEKLRKNAGGRRVAHKKGFNLRRKLYFLAAIVACVVLGVFAGLMSRHILTFRTKFRV